MSACILHTHTHTHTHAHTHTLTHSHTYSHTHMQGLLPWSTVCSSGAAADQQRADQQRTDQQRTDQQRGNISSDGSGTYRRGSGPAGHDECRLGQEPCGDRYILAGFASSQVHVHVLYSLGCAVLLCLVVCLTLFASLFLPSHLSCIKTLKEFYFIDKYFIHVHACTCTCVY